MGKTRSLPFVGVRMKENRTPTGRRTATPAKHAALYIAYGKERQAQIEQRMRGQWLGPDGKARSHEAVMAWAREKALQHRYTFQAILSVPEGDLTPEAFCQAMQQGRQIDDWMLMTHSDTEHSHAHVLFFQDKRIEKERFLAWQAEIRAELVLQEQKQLDGLQQELALGKEAGRQQGGHSWM